MDNYPFSYLHLGYERALVRFGMTPDTAGMMESGEVRQLRLRESRGEELRATQRLYLERVRARYRKAGNLLGLRAEKITGKRARRTGKLLTFPSAMQPS